MAAATLTEKGQIVIPADIRARYELTPGTQVEFVDEGGVIRLLVRRRVAPSDPQAGYGMIKIAPSKAGSTARRLSEFDPASLLKKSALKRKRDEK
ncbi:MAG: AbrB/MazE/SpoVT family DNA-binding domain-containing protein [Burkholderiaceae bacterium]|nr:AbrB/MazE/SpoVT family DNA-binding domain-containing protein [Burkholderiaceae bacterium]